MSSTPLPRTAAFVFPERKQPTTTKRASPMDTVAARLLVLDEELEQIQNALDTDELEITGSRPLLLTNRK